MAKTDLKEQVLQDQDWRELAPLIWNAVPDIPYEWKSLGAASRDQLAAIAPEVAIPFNLSNLALNIELRRQLGAALRRSDADRLALISSWILRSWGGIKGGARRDGSDAMHGWVGNLVGFEPEAIARHVSTYGQHRISSWSKILAFARPDQDAIYDSRTAVTLNVALCALGSPHRFHMPDSQNSEIGPVTAILTSRNDRLCYRDYLRLLTEIQILEPNLSFTHIETRLFAAAPTIASKFVREIQPHLRAAAQRVCAA